MGYVVAIAILILAIIGFATIVHGDFDPKAIITDTASGVQRILPGAEPQPTSTPKKRTRPAPKAKGGKDGRPQKERQTGREGN